MVPGRDNGDRDQVGRGPRAHKARLRKICSMKSLHLQHYLVTVGAPLLLVGVLAGRYYDQIVEGSGPASVMLWVGIALLFVAAIVVGAIEPHQASEQASCVDRGGAAARSHEGAPAQGCALAGPSSSPRWR